MFNFNFKKFNNEDLNNKNELNTIQFICSTESNNNPSTVADLTKSLMEMQKRHNQLNSIINMIDEGTSSSLIREIV